MYHDNYSYSMSQYESNLMKGVAILLMIFFHLFNNLSNPEFTGTFLGNLAQTQNPVPFYLILSGYGMYYVIHRDQPDEHRYSRIVKLYVTYWIITTTFVVISKVMGDTRCNLTPIEILYNMSGIATSFNPTTWFIFPYTMLSLSSPIICRILDQVGSISLLVIGFLFYVMASYMNQFDWFRSNPFQYFYLLFPFLLGMVICRNRMIDQARSFFVTKVRWLPWILLAILIGVRYFVPTGAFAAVYAALFTVLFVVANRPHLLDIVLTHLGRHSTNMWMIHAWIIHYLLYGFVHNLYPGLSFIVSVIISYLISMIFEQCRSLIKSINV